MILKVKSDVTLTWIQNISQTTKIASVSNTGKKSGLLCMFFSKLEHLIYFGYFSQFDLTKHHIWSKNVEVTEQILHTVESVTEQSSKLSALNLAHNLFTSIPVVLPCLAVNLTRLNMAFNSLRSMSHITSYPSSLKQLDLSHNQITCWPSLPQVEAQDVMELANIACYASNLASREKVSGIAGIISIIIIIIIWRLCVLARRQPGRSVRNTVLHSVCSHRRHLKLDSLRTLILADNQLSRIQLTTDDDGDVSAVEEEDLERVSFS